MNKFLYAIFSEAGTNLKEYKVYKVKVINENKDYVEIELDHQIRLKKIKTCLFETRHIANMYIKNNILKIGKK